MKLSIVIPTYNEKENINKLLRELKEESEQNKINIEIIVVDDNSPDGTGDFLEELKSQYKNLVVIHRRGKLGLSSAVVEGFKVATGEVLCVMDADLSHPVYKIHEMYQQITTKGADLVIGSRYIIGGKIEGWNLYRRVLSKGATFLARVFVDIKDPMSGFFMMKKEFIINKIINPKGFKILFELLVKINFKNVVEVPITFVNRTKGKSKAGFKEIFYYLENLFSYITYKGEVVLQFAKFSLVGLVGTFINIFILYIFTERFKIYYLISAIFAFIFAVISNFILNKIWTFSEKIYERLVEEFISFFVVSLSAFVVNIFFLYIFTEFFHIYYIISQIVSIGISLMINFIGNKIWTFHK